MPYTSSITSSRRQRDFAEIYSIVTENAPKIAEMPGTCRTQAQIRALFADITRSSISGDLHINLPFYSDLGRHLRIRRSVFINNSVMFTDLGSITL